MQSASAAWSRASWHPRIRPLTAQMGSETVLRLQQVVLRARPFAADTQNAGEDAAADAEPIPTRVDRGLQRGRVLGVDRRCLLQDPRPLADALDAREGDLLGRAGLICDHEADRPGAEHP